MSASSLGEVTSQSPTAGTRKIAEFGAIDCNDELSRVDGFASEVEASAAKRVYVIVYGGRQSIQGEALARGERIMRYLVRDRVISRERIGVIHGGYREQLSVELWISQNESCTPVTTPTVSAEDVKFKPGRVTRLGYLCN